MGVQDEGQIQKAFLRSYVGDVRQSQTLLWADRPRSPREAGQGREQPADRGGWFYASCPSHTAPESRSSHQSSYPLAAVPYSKQT
jgi:hypothetical protein